MVNFRNENDFLNSISISKALFLEIKIFFACFHRRQMKTFMHTSPNNHLNARSILLRQERHVQTK